MEKIEAGQVPRPQREERSPAAPLRSPDARSWWPGLGAHFGNWRYIYVLIVLVIYSNIVLRAQLRGNPHDDRVPDEGPVSDSSEPWTEWLDITPSEKLRWQPCFGVYGPNLQCARLTVPMDYSRPLNASAAHPKVHLALIMVTGAGRTKDPSTYAEAPLLVNPGGPGGSGVAFTQGRAASLQILVGNQHDIIGFDPRGVGYSTPKADCFASPNGSNGVSGRNVAFMNRLAWLASGQGIGVTNSSNVALTQLAARSKAIGKLCQRIDETQGDSSIFRYMSTPNHARDMLSIIQAWDEWRLGSQTMQPMQPDTAQPPVEQQPSDYDEDSKTSLRGKLVYWGFSYGTLLGATFASMFPDKVGRIVLDGVVNADHYVKPMWETSLVDTDAIWDRFFVSCAEAGALCDFYRAGDGPEELRARFKEIMSSLEAQPAVVLLPDTNLAALVTASDVKKSILFAGLYAPIVGFPVIAELLDRVLRDKLGGIAKGAGMASLCGNFTLPVWPDDSITAVACGDKRRKLNEGVPELQARFESAASYSWFADVWFGIEPNLGCSGWEIESKEPPMRWHDDPTHKPALIQTSFPILLFSNTLDPVTPLEAALAMTRKFANASIVEQDGSGHCTLSCWSSCTIKHLRAYFNEGVVPPPPKFKSDVGNEGQWPTCQCFEGPWTSPGRPAAEESMSGIPATGDHVQAYRELRAHFSISMLSQQLDYNNPLKSYLVERTRSLAGGYP
ncbi:Alpha/Beta hydrolase protein [Nemania sp. NC0429]|nr:Alpha/Beta hydrolase protein [Nemania sp. NC0429]